MMGGLYIATYTNPLVARVRLVLQKLHQEYQQGRKAGLRELLQGDLRELKVLDGPFTGLRYPTARSLGSCFYAKILGSYEKELHGPIERLLKSRNYDAIVDVGAAEGYYAVGFAMRCPRARVFAYDTAPTSKDLLFEMARANSVADQMEFGHECTGPTLVELSQQFPSGLLISDCEGYELELLEPATIAALSRWDMLIETHDYLERNITHELTRRLQRTHRVSVLRRRRRTLRDYPGPQGPSKMVRLAALDEERGWRCRWLCCESLSC